MTVKRLHIHQTGIPKGMRENRAEEALKELIVANCPELMNIYPNIQNVH